MRKEEYIEFPLENLKRGDNFGVEGVGRSVKTKKVL